MSQFFSKGGSDFFGRENSRSTAMGGGMSSFFSSRDQQPAVGSYDYRKRETNDLGTVGIRYKESVGNKDNRDQRNHQLASIMFMWEYEAHGASLFRKRCEDYVLMRQGKLPAANAEGVGHAIKQSQINPKVVHADLAKAGRAGGASWYGQTGGYFGNNASSGTSTWGGTSSFFGQGQNQAKATQGFGAGTATGTGSSWTGNTTDRTTWGQTGSFFGGGGAGSWGKPADPPTSTQSSISNYFAKKPNDAGSSFFGASGQTSNTSGNFFGTAGRTQTVEPPKSGFFKTAETGTSGTSGGFFGAQNSTQGKSGSSFFGQTNPSQSFGNSSNFFGTQNTIKSSFFGTGGAQNQAPAWGAKPNSDFFSQPAQSGSSNFFSFKQNNNSDFFSKPAEAQTASGPPSFFGNQNNFWQPQNAGPFPSAGMPAFNPFQASSPYMMPPGYFPWPGYIPGVPPYWPGSPYPTPSPNQSIIEQKKEIVSALKTDEEYKFNVEAQMKEEFRRQVLEAQHQSKMIQIVKDALGDGYSRPDEIDISIRMPTFPSRNSSIRKSPAINSAIKSRLAASVSPSPIRGRDSKPKPDADNQSLSSAIFSSKNKISSFPSFSSINKYQSDKEISSQFRFKAKVSYLDCKFYLEETSVSMNSTVGQTKIHLLKMLPSQNMSLEELLESAKISFDNGIYPDNFRLKDVAKLDTRQVHLIIDLRSKVKPENEPSKPIKSESQEERNFEKKKHSQKEEEENFGPILTKPGYSTSPPIVNLLRMPKDELQAVRNFSIRNEFGKIKWIEPVSLVGANLDLWVQIRRESIDVYPEDLFDSTNKPEFGFGLNKPALITLNGIKPKSSQSLITFEERLKEMCKNQDAEFVKYDPAKAKWKFKVKQF